MKRISDKNKIMQRADAIISIWQQKNTYSADDIVYDALHNHIVKRTSINPAESTETTPPSESNRWTLVNSVPVWAANINYPLNFILEQNGVLYKCNNAHTSTTFVADTANWTAISSGGGGGGTGTWFDTYTVYIGPAIDDDYPDIIALNAFIVENLIFGRVLNICFDGGAITANDALIYQPQFKEINIIAGNDPLDDIAWVPVNSPLESLTVINAGNQIINFAGVWTINSIYLDKVNLIGGPTNPSSITFNGSSAFHRCNASYNMTITSTFEDVMIYDPSGHWIITGTFITRVHGHVNCDAIYTDGRVFFTRAQGNCDSVYQTAASPISSPFVAVEQSYMGISTIDIGSNLVDEGLGVYSAVAIVGNVMGTPNVSVFNQTPNIATANGMIYAAGDGSGNYPQVITYTTSRTSVHDDVGKYIRYDSATDVTYSIDQEGTLFPLSGEIHIEQVNTGKVTVEVALLSDGEIIYESLFVPTTRGQQGVITIKKTVHGATRADDKFTVFGALEEAPI